MNIARHLLMGGIVCAGLASCSDDANDGRFPAEAGNAVHFAASSPSTRTIYDDENIFQINWETNDAIRIYSNKAYEGVADANYTVTPIETAGEGSNKLYNTGTIAASGEDQLVWADNNEHKFIGVYPNDNAKISVNAEQGIVTLPINRNQYGELVKVSEDSYYSTKYSGYTYYAKPDMRNAYLVAYNALTPEQAAATNGDVFLNFKPVMTAIEVVVKGRENANDASVQVMGISINRTVPAGTESSTSFEWNAATGTTVSALPDNYTGNTQITSNFVGLKGGATVTLKGGESVVFTVFLPPYAINEQWPIKVRVHATGAAEVYTKNITNEILASNKRRVTLPNFKTEQTGNNWITPLDGNIYVSQMSIPGSHDAATGESMATIIGAIFAATQENTLDKQWDLGARAFDLRPAIYDPVLESTNELWLYHGVTRVSISWATAMNTIKAKLTEQPGEFAIVLFRHEDESTVGKNTSTTDFNTYMTNYINANSSWIVDWKPNLTIDEARGKVILISRFKGSWNYGCFTGWSHAPEGTTTTLQNADGSKSATMYVQDYYNSSSHEAKWTSIQTYLNISRQFHANAGMTNHWMINHASGYANTSTSSTYRNNAAYQNPKLIETLTDPAWEGSTGIMLFDYSGAATSGSTTVKGDVALQAIINNNYKYTMQRKE